jgi:hypothetical protein
VFTTSELPYEGELLPERLFEEFAKEFHCPTAVQVPHLDYVDETTGADVKVILLGNPTCIGPNMNSSDRVSPSLHLSKKYLNVEYRRGSKKSCQEGGKLKVFDNCIHFSISPKEWLDVNNNKAEILTCYENDCDESKFFVEHSEDKIFCDVCFSLLDEISNPIVCCDRKDCFQGRHLKCFQGETAITVGDVPQLKHYCADHKMSSSGPTLRVRKTSPPSKDIPRSNLPPPFTQSGVNPPMGQMYHQESDLVGLYMNCQALHVTTRKSGIEGAGDGLFADKQYEKGDTIGFFFGHIVSNDEYNHKFVNETGDSIFENTFEAEFMKEAQSGLVRCLDVSDSLQDKDNEYKLLVSKQCPVGYINDPGFHLKKAKKRKALDTNCKITFPQEVSVKEDGTFCWKTFPVIATKTIYKGNEFFFNY